MNDTLIGSWITLNHPSIAELMADAGFDWLCVDMEHSVIDYAEAQQLITTIQAKGIKAFVRVGENNMRIIKRVLDAGADGIIVPMVNSKADAIKAINAVKYPPIGQRGVGLARAQKYGFGFNDYKDNYAKDIKLIVQIEHLDAINNLEEILSLVHIDGTFIGPYDLSGSLNVPGEWGHPDVINALDKVKKVISNHKKPGGFHVVHSNHKELEQRIIEGYTFIAYGDDMVFFAEAIASNADFIFSLKE